MNFDDQTIGPARDSGTRYRQNVLPFTGGMARVEKDRQVSLGFEHRHSVDVGRVAGRGLKSPNPALTEHDAPVAVRDDVFGSHQQVFDGGGHAAFEQDGALGFADGVQQVEVLHVARPDLEHVGVFGDQFDLLRGHDLGHDRHTGQFAGLGQNLQPGFAHALEGVGRGARFEGPAAQGVRPGFFDGLRRFEQLLAALDRTRPGDDQDFVAANFDPVDVEHRVLFLEFARSQFIRTRNAGDVVDAGHERDYRRVNLADVADDADDVALRAAHDVGAQAFVFNQRNRSGEFDFACVGFHDNHHNSGSPWGE
jgi:hypothetical protein